MLKDIFIQLVLKYSSDESKINEFWNEIEVNYSSKKRHYHTLAHLENLYQQLLEVKDEISDWETILFTLFYHDIIYNSLKSDNEEKSAELAEKRMFALNVAIDLVEKCKVQILATKSHIVSSNLDTNYFLDADLSILGDKWENYLIYLTNVRKEYSFYPDILYNPGRKKVLNHFLSMERIFKTDYFRSKFEKTTKENLKKEIELL